jgi:hypothetical protein
MLGCMSPEDRKALTLHMPRGSKPGTKRGQVLFEQWGPGGAAVRRPLIHGDRLDQPVGLDQFQQGTGLDDRTFLPSASATAIAFTIVCDLPVPGGPSTARFFPSAMSTSVLN